MSFSRDGKLHSRDPCDDGKKLPQFVVEKEDERGEEPSFLLLGEPGWLETSRGRGEGECGEKWKEVLWSALGGRGEEEA